MTDKDAKKNEPKKPQASSEKASLPQLRSDVTVVVAKDRAVTGFDHSPKQVTVDTRIRRLIEDGDLIVKS